MPQYTPPVRDTRFILEHVVGLERHANLPGFANTGADVVDAVLEEGGRFVAEMLFPLNQTGDAEAVTKDGVTTVSVPIVPTAEVCTMQVVKVQSASSVAVAEDVTSIEVQLLSPGGEVQAEGKTDIAANSPDCVALKAE